MTRTFSLLLIPALILVSASTGSSQTGYPEFLRTSFVAESDDARAVFVNPGGLLLNRSSNATLDVSFAETNWKNTAFAWQTSFLSFGFTSTDVRLESRNQNALSLATSFENRRRNLGVGTAFRWIWGPGEDAGAWDFGLTYRPLRYASIGGVVRNANEPTVGFRKFAREWVGGVSLRLPSTNRITGSYQAVYNGVSEETDHLIGGRIDAFKGIQLFGSYYTKDEDFSIGLQIAMPHFGVSHSVRAVDQKFNDQSLQTVSILTNSDYKKESVQLVKTVAELEISGSYEDYDNGFVLFGTRTKSAVNLIKKLESIAEDDDVAALVIRMGYLGPAFIGKVSAQHQEIRRAIERVSTAGKPVVVFLENYPAAGELYLASAADYIIMHETSFVNGIGVAVELDRLKGLFNKFGVDWDVVTAGDYKSSFHTPYTDSSSNVQKQMIQQMVNTAYEEMVTTIFEARNIPMDKKDQIAHGGIVLAKDAVSLNLIDRLGFYEDAVRKTGEMIGKDKAKPFKMKRREYWVEDWKLPPAVAVVTAYGEIVQGESQKDFFGGERTMGSSTVVGQLKRASTYPGVKAIVLRVNSGGGSAIASAIILNEIERIRREKKIPVIVSMADVAGSGGYLISIDSDAIVANPLTVTGSIGAIGVKPVFRELMDTLRINHEVFKAGEYSDMYSFARKLNKEERKMAEEAIDHLYELFLDKVKAGRDMTGEEMEKAAGGRVFMGKDALGVGLVDELGGLAEAIEFAAKKSDIARDYRVLVVRSDRFSWPDRISESRVVKAFLEVFGGPFGPFSPISVEEQ